MTAPITPKIAVHFDGQIMTNWQSATITTDVDDLCATVELSITQESPNNYFTADINSILKIYDASTLQPQSVQADSIINNWSLSKVETTDLITTARIDQLNREITADSHKIKLTARSLARELVDCQISKTIRGKKLAQIIADLCQNFDIPFIEDAPSENVPEFSMQCESPAHQILQLIRSANLYLVPTADGGIKLTTHTSTPLSNQSLLIERSRNCTCQLTYGIDFKSYLMQNNYQERFSDYLIKGNGSHNSFAIFQQGENYQAAKGYFKDDLISYKRPLEVVADRSHSTGSCERRAELEYFRRKARAERIEVTLAGWRNSNGDLWSINTPVQAIIEPENFNRSMHVARCSLALDENGSTTTLSLTQPVKGRL